MVEIHITDIIPLIGIPDPPNGRRILKTLVDYEIGEKMYPSAQRHAMSGLAIEPYDIDFKASLVICMYAQNNRSIAENYLATIKAEISDEQKERIRQFQVQKSLK